LDSSENGGCTLPIDGSLTAEIVGDIINDNVVTNVGAVEMFSKVGPVVADFVADG